MERGSGERRPAPTLEHSTWGMIAEGLALLGLIATLVILGTAWPDLPDRVPTHFGASGEADRWGSKTSLLLPLILMVVLYAGLTVMNRFPHVFNYPWRLTEENAQRQYRLVRAMVAGLKAQLVWIFTYTTWRAVEVAQGDPSGLNLLVMLALVFSMFLTIGVYIFVASRPENDRRQVSDNPN